MNYNKQLQELINKASKEGYKFKDGKFEKTIEEMFPVMEVFFIDNTTYEEHGKYYIYKKTVAIEEGDYNKIIKYAASHNYQEIKCNYKLEGAFLNEIIHNIVRKYDKSNINFVLTNVGGTITIEYRDDYHKYTNNDECVNLWFIKENDNDDFPRGFISFYMIKKDDFEKSENVKIHLGKFMRDN